MPRDRICIVTSAPISNNPRVVKEADALTQAGFQVRVVSSQHAAWVVPWDRDLAACKQWQNDPVRWDHSTIGSCTRRYVSRMRQSMFLYGAHCGWEREPFLEASFCRLYRELLARVCKEPADLVIGHNPQALPVACKAAEKMGVPAAFDSEDDHFGELPDSEQDSMRARLLHRIEEKYLRRCRYVTAASQGIAEALAQRYGIPTPTAIHNVFPWSDRLLMDAHRKDRDQKGLSLYWFSQVIGLDRGLQDLIRAAGLVLGEITIYLRGNLEESVRNELLCLARGSTVLDRVRFLDRIPPQELLSRSAEHDIGMALEQPVSKNRLMTVTNKIFFYMLSGLAVIATDTPGQRTIMQSCPDAGFLYAPGDAPALATIIQKLHDHPELLQRVRVASLEAARTRWNWEQESKILVELVMRVLAEKRATNAIPLVTTH